MTITITSAEWLNEEETAAKVLFSDGRSISVPKTEGVDVDGNPVPVNSDWSTLKKWVDAGGVIADYVAVAETRVDFLDKTDKAMNRVAEDAMVLLLQKEVIAKSDMPDAMWTKINARRVKRGLSEV